MEIGSILAISLSFNYLCAPRVLEGGMQVIYWHGNLYLLCGKGAFHAMVILMDSVVCRMQV